MIAAKDIFLTALVPGLFMLPLWIITLLILRKINFNPDGKRKINLHETEESIRIRVIEYHNNATYRAFEFYIKVLLALFGGIAFIVIQDSPLSEKARIMINAGGWIIVVVTVLFCFLVFGHQKSRVERWQNRYLWYEPLLWNECWLIASAVALAFFTKMTLIPQIIQ